MTVNIKGKDVTLKYSFRAMMIYENITKKTFEPKGLTEFIILFYSLIMAADKESELTFDEFVDWLDEHTEQFNDFIIWLEVTTAKNNYLSKKEDSKDTDEKKT